MSDVARAIDVSPSMISQIERGQALPSVSTLFSLADALGAKVDVFFDESNLEGGAPPAGRQGVRTPHYDAPDAGENGDSRQGDRLFVPAGARAAVDIRGGIRWERLTPRPVEGLEFLELIYDKGAESSSQPYSHSGMEMVIVLSGRLDVFVGFERYELRAGDSITLESSKPHRYANPSDHEARAITLILDEVRAQDPQLPEAPVARSSST